MRNTLAHIFGLWKLAINLHCILVGTILLANSEDNLLPFELQSFGFPLRVPFISLQNKARKDSRVKFSQDSICFADCFPETGCHPEARAFGSQQVLTLHFKSLSWSLKNYDLYFSFLDTRADPPEMKTTVFCLSQHCRISMHLPLKAFKYLTYTFLNTPSGLSWSGLIPKKTEVEVELFPAIILSFLINYSISRHLWDIGELLCNKEAIRGWIFQCMFPYFPHF